jgi:hypothetical protein
MWSELVAFADVDRLDRVGKPKLFQQDDSLLAISSRPEIQVDHGISSCFWDRRMWIVTIAALGCPLCFHRRAASYGQRRKAMPWDALSP